MENFSEKVEKVRLVVWQHYRKIIDDLGPFLWQRWAGTGFLLFVFMWRVIALQGYYLVTYALGIYLLNQFMLFLSPKIDPEGEESLLPLSNSLDEDFRPFIRALPEKSFWLHATTALLISFFLTFIPLFNIPVFWPILLIYFIALTFATMKNQIAHMIKYKYLPWEYGKKRYVREQEPKLFSD